MATSDSRHLRLTTGQPRALRQLMDVWSTYLDWLEHHPELDTPGPDQLLDETAFLVATAGEHAGLEDLFGLSAAVVDVLASRFESTRDVTAVVALTVLTPMIIFLVMTGRWTRPPHELELIRRRVIAATASIDPAAAAAALEEGERAAASLVAAEADAVDALPLTGQARALLRWVERRRSVTPGAMPSADLAAAAATVGVTAPPRVTSMEQLPHLRDVWGAAAEAGALSSDRTGAGLAGIAVTPRGHALISGDVEVALALVRAYLVRCLSQPGRRPELPSPGEFVSAVLSLALRPPHDTTGVAPDFLTLDGSRAAAIPEVAAVLAGEGPQVTDEVILAPARSLLERLGQAGIVQLTPTTRIPPGLQTLVVGALADVLAP